MSPGDSSKPSGDKSSLIPWGKVAMIGLLPPLGVAVLAPLALVQLGWIDLPNGNERVSAGLAWFGASLGIVGFALALAQVQRISRDAVRKFRVVSGVVTLADLESLARNALTAAESGNIIRACMLVDDLRTGVARARAASAGNIESIAAESWQEMVTDLYIVRGALGAMAQERTPDAPATAETVATGEGPMGHSPTAQGASGGAVAQLREIHLELADWSARHASSAGESHVQ